MIFLSFAGVKANNFKDAQELINILIGQKYNEWRDFIGYEGFDDKLKQSYDGIGEGMNGMAAAMSLNKLCELLEHYFGRKAVILLDEYDAPMQEAWVGGYWDEIVSFIRSLFNNTFKTNPHLERAVMTGITRISKESIFSDLNNLKVITTSSKKYETAFGFTEEEVFVAVDSQGFDPELKKDVKFWYDGFTFGTKTDIYNPWSVTSFLDTGELGAWWADTSSNSFVSKLIRTGDPGLKEIFESLLKEESFRSVIDEQIVFSDLENSDEAVLSLLLASGYLRVKQIIEEKDECNQPRYIHELMITNYETRLMFRKMVADWFKKAGSNYSEFIRCMLAGNVEDMNNYMERIARDTFSSFDAGTKPSEKEPERFYHGFVLGLMVDRAEDYVLKSNRESGFGRYDVVMEPKDANNVAVILEFKVFNKKKEKELSDTVRNALKQIEDRHYDADLLTRGIPADRIYKYGFAFRGSECLIGMGQA